MDTFRDVWILRGKYVAFVLTEVISTVARLWRARIGAALGESRFAENEIAD